MTKQAQAIHLHRRLMDAEFLSESKRKCLVCGAGVSVFSSRKIGRDICADCSGFFRTRVQAGDSGRSCRNNGECIITRTTRTKCSECRFSKCLAVGLKPERFKQLTQSDSTCSQVESKSISEVSLPCGQHASERINERDGHLNDSENTFIADSSDNTVADSGLGTGSEKSGFSPQESPVDDNRDAEMNCDNADAEDLPNIINRRANHEEDPNSESDQAIIFQLKHSAAEEALVSLSDMISTEESNVLSTSDNNWRHTFCDSYSDFHDSLSDRIFHSGTQLRAASTKFVHMALKTYRLLRPGVRLDYLDARWREIFILSVDSNVFRDVLHYYKENWAEISKTSRDLTTEILHLKILSILVKFKSSLKLDENELYMLKALVLFQPSSDENTVTCDDTVEVHMARFFDIILEDLKNYIKNKCFGEESDLFDPLISIFRPGDILYLLRCVKFLKSSRIAEKVFFTKAVQGREELPVTPRKSGLSSSTV